MAEFVEQHMQETVQEIEEMERLNLLSSDEIKKLIEKRRDHEYQICKPRKEKRCFINYVLYEIKLIELLSLRRQRLYMFKRFNEIERKIIQRVINRLRMMSRLWQSHPDVWKLRISFAKSRKYFDEVSASYVEQIRYFGDNESIWVGWAQWEMQGRKNFDKARTILLSRAPLYHPNSLSLSREHFRVELLFVEYLKNKSATTNIQGLEEIIAENREKVLNCAVAEVVYRNAQNKFNSAELYLEFHSVAKKFPFAQHLTDKIIRDLLNNFPNDEVVWKLKGKMILEGEDITVINGEEEKQADDNNDEEEKKGKEKKVHKPLIPIEKLKEFMKLNDEALNAVGFSYLESYLRDLLKLLHEVWGAEEFEAVISHKILMLFESNAERLSSVQFLIWYNVALLMKKPSASLTLILKRGASLHPDCPHIRLQLYQVAFPKTKIKGKKEMLEKLTGEIGAKICMEIINNSLPIQQKNLTKNACVHHDREFCKAFRVKRLEALKTLADCRSHYDNYANVPPFSIEFHTSVLYKELSETEKSVARIQQVFDMAIEQFGNTEIGLWLSYIDFEKRFGNRRKATTLEERASAELKTDLWPQFIDLKFAVQSQLDSKVKPQTNEVLVDYSQSPSDENNSSLPIMVNSSLPALFEEELSLTYSSVEKKKAFFKTLVDLEKKFQVKPSFKVNENRLELWESIFSLICGQSVSFSLKKVDLDDIGSTKETEEFFRETDKNFHENIEKRNEKLSDELKEQQTSLLKKKGSSKDDLKAALAASEVLDSAFIKKKEIDPYFKSKNAVKKERQNERMGTSGEGWFNMKVPQKTEEVERDLNLLKMRAVLDPTRHYKRSDMKQTPKFFQMGKVIDSPVDFYTSRIPKKQRKATFADEIINDEKVLQYQNRKSKEIIQRREAKRRKIMKIKNTTKGKVKSKKKS